MKGVDIHIMQVGIGGILILGLVATAISLEFGRDILQEEMDKKFGEEHISTNCDGFADVFDCDIYNKEGEFLGRYHREIPWGFFIDKEGARTEVKIIKLHSEDN